LRHPAIADARNTLHRRIRYATKPDRDGMLDWQRIEASLSDRVPFPRVGHYWLLPERAQDLDLLLEPLPARVEVLVERLVLDLVPADTDA
jgi:hypothetical protein